MGQITVFSGAGRRRRRSVSVVQPILPAISGSSAAESNAISGDWPSYNRTLTSERYSPLSQINTNNAKSLKVRPLAFGCREGLWGMIGVDQIGQIRRAYFEQGRPIKEIVRTLSVSRATVRKVIRGQETTEFRYSVRAAQPSPKLGPWIKVLVEILEDEAKLPRRERRSTQRLFETLRGRGYDGAHDSVHRYAKAWPGTPRHGAAISGGRRRGPVCL